MSGCSFVNIFSHTDFCKHHGASPRWLSLWLDSCCSSSNVAICYSWPKSHFLRSLNVIICEVQKNMQHWNKPFKLALGPGSINCFGVFFQPLQDTFDVGSASLAAVVSLANFVVRSVWGWQRFITKFPPFFACKIFLSCKEPPFCKNTSPHAGCASQHVF